MQKIKEEKVALMAQDAQGQISGHITENNADPQNEPPSLVACLPPVLPEHEGEEGWSYRKSD